MEIGSLDLAKEAIVALIQSGYPWVIAATKVEMVRQGHAKVGNLPCPTFRFQTCFY